MPLTPDEIDALPILTTVQKLKLANYRYQRLLEQMQEGGTNGRSVRHVDLETVRKEIADLEQQAAAESSGPAGLGNVLVNLSRP